MPKTFIIKDEDGKKFEITEETVDEMPEEKDKAAEPEVKDDEGLTVEEIAALKELAAHSADLIKLLEVEKKEHEAVSEEDEEPDVLDEETCDEEEKEEEVIETKTGDSKKSVGSIEKRKAKDSILNEDRELEIADAWSKRFKNTYRKGE